MRLTKSLIGSPLRVACFQNAFTDAGASSSLRVISTLNRYLSDQVDHLARVIEAIGPLLALGEFLVAFLEVFEDVLAEPAATALVGLLEEAPVRAHRLEHGVTTLDESAQLLVLVGGSGRSHCSRNPYSGAGSYVSKH
jgi:hypothetical protein